MKNRGLTPILYGVPKGQRRRGAQHLARREPRVEGKQRDAGERTGDPQPGARRQVELEHAAGEELADRRRAQGREDSGHGAHRQELDSLRAGDLFVALKNEHEGVLEAEIASAFPLDDAALATLKADLEARFKARLNVTVNIDPELIGGVRIAVGDEVIDASVRGKLANMAAALKK